MNSFLEPATLLKIIKLKITTKRNVYCSRILFKSLRGLALQNTPSYICRKKFVHGVFKIIEIYVNNK